MRNVVSNVQQSPPSPQPSLVPHNLSLVLKIMIIVKLGQCGAHFPRKDVIHMYFQYETLTNTNVKI